MGLEIDKADDKAFLVAWYQQQQQQQEQVIRDTGRLHAFTDTVDFRAIDTMPVGVLDGGEEMLELSLDQGPGACISDPVAETAFDVVQLIVGKICGHGSGAIVFGNHVKELYRMMCIKL